ncbi:MAG: organic hydroperoxide resistance protein [Gammaproteobacteria bacterium]|nr:organic hydroperoxide resistance protein [Gammaproteobacteria bacterium]MDH3410857.1 organic hydroperoxide resistance protein [Gammaproteobacteria bacterium]
MKIAYKTTASATGGRDGKAATADGSFEVKMTTPKELGGPGGEGNNPEQLFAAGYSACYLGALKYVAGQEKVKIPNDARVTATVGIGPRDDSKGFGIDVDLEVSLPGIDKSKSEDLVKKAHVVCPYSHATRGNIDVRTSIA